MNATVKALVVSAAVVIGSDLVVSHFVSPTTSIGPLSPANTQLAARIATGAAIALLAHKVF